MLEQLLRYGREHGLKAEPGFAPKQIRWAIEINADGRFLEVHEIGDVGDKKNKGRQFDKCPNLSQPELVGGSEARCHFLADSTQTVALLFKDNDDEKVREKQSAKHAFFVKLLQDCSEDYPELAAAANALSDAEALKEIQDRLTAKGVKPGDKVTLRIGGAYPLDAADWHGWWRGFRESLNPKSEGKGDEKQKPKTDNLMRCFATGELAEPVATHLKIERLSDVGGLPTGDSLMCYDKEAFQSYSLAQSTNGAVSEQAMSEYRDSLNALIRDHGRKLAGAKVVHWFDKPVVDEEDPVSWLEESSDQQERGALKLARELLESIEKGTRPDLAGNRFYVLTLSGASGRVMVRDWMEGSFEQLLRNVIAWFGDLAVVHREGGRPAPDPKFLAVLGCTVRDLKDLPAPFISKMWRVAVLGEAFPIQAQARALLRARTAFIKEEVPNHARFALLKACLIRSNQGGAPMDIYLNENHPSPAYHCGRLLSVLADLQYSALGDVGAGVVQRYYAAASSTPALVLGRLIRTAQFHISKSKAPGFYQNRIAEIWTRLHDHVPATLTLEEQTIFALGYYQQMAKDRWESKQNKARKAENSEADDQ